MGFNLATPGGLPTYLKNAYTVRILLIILLMIFLVILLIMINFTSNDSWSNDNHVQQVHNDNAKD